MPNPFAPSFDQLPGVIPIFPLPGALLLPRGILPLNIFEPRYLNMTQAAMSGDRTIGMIQPTEAEGPDHPPAVYTTGCVGRITSYSETEDGRLLITLTGLCRFEVAEELPLLDGYRRVRADYGRFGGDMFEDAETSVERDRLLAALRGFLGQRGIDANWDAVQTLADDRLVTALSMMCPFEPNEKQALLEAPDTTERGKVLVALLEMADAAADDGHGHVNH